jgi:D-arabinan exo alpha-(1,3)/(1,5)-arabinofuranosidase (non-reducing end)
MEVIKKDGLIMFWNRYQVCAIVVISLLFFPVAQSKTVTTQSLLEEMIDLGRLSDLPSPAYKTVQFSSYDRSSKLPNGPGWFANADGFGREPIPAVLRTLKQAGADKVGTYVIAEVTGPGVLVRGWTAGVRSGMNGTIRMYLDNSKKPVFEGSATDFLVKLYPAMFKQHYSGMGGKPIGEGYTQRDAGYYPVAFATGCRVEWTGRLDRVHFYHIEFRKYARDTKVKTFQPRELVDDRKTIDRVASVLVDPSRQSLPKGKIIDIDTALIPGGTVELFGIDKKSGQVAWLELKLEADNLNDALRQTLLLGYFDKHSRPQIEAPLGDFFGAAPGINPYDSLPMKVEPDGTMICRFPMPFASSASFWAINKGSEKVSITGRVVIADKAWTESSMHFYAHWRVNHEMSITGDKNLTGLLNRRGFDVPFVFAHGAGRFVGCSVHLMNPSRVSTGNWWGEGDEKIFVDDDVAPSFFGTGSEDYFNYSWSSADLFIHAYFAQPRCDGPRTRGFVVNNRWHIIDDIPFNSHFTFLMEMIHHNELEGFSFARISYYYGKPGIFSDQTPIQPEDLRPPRAPENWMPGRLGRQKNAEYTQFEDIKEAEGLILRDPFWAAGGLVAWQPRSDGEKLTLTFNVKRAGKYQVYYVMGLSPASGRCAVAINGKTIIKRSGKERVLDLYTPYHTMARHFTPGKLNLPAGENTITFISRGRNEESRGNLIGADYLWIQP